MLPPVCKLCCLVLKINNITKSWCRNDWAQYYAFYVIQLLCETSVLNSFKLFLCDDVCSRRIFVVRLKADWKRTESGLKADRACKNFAFYRLQDSRSWRCTGYTIVSIFCCSISSFLNKSQKERKQHSLRSYVINFFIKNLPQKLYSQ